MALSKKELQALRSLEARMAMTNDGMKRLRWSISDTAKAWRRHPWHLYPRDDG